MYRGRAHHHRHESQQNNQNYADIPPPTPLPDNSDYEDFQIQQQHISGTPSSVSLQNYAQQQQQQQQQRHQHDEQAPPYEAAAGRPMQRSTSSMVSLQDDEQQNSRTSKKNLKQMGLNFLNARQHLALAFCRDVVLLPPSYHAFKAFKYTVETFSINESSITDVNYIPMLTTASPTEYFLAGVWCFVAAYLSYQVIDGLMVRWIVTYQTSAAILRVLSISMFLITIETGALSIFSPEGSYSLHTWILISCVLTGAYIIQNFVTSNLDPKAGNRRRTIDYYNIAVFAVVPVGLASFISMIVLLRVLLIIRLDLSGKELLDGIFTNTF